MSTLYIIIGIVAVVAVAAVVLAKGKSKDGNVPPSSVKEEEAKEPTGDPELYKLGMNPISSKLIMYALETCQHCKNTRKYLDSKNADYVIIYLDQYSKEQRAELMEKVRSYNPRGTFPTMVVPGGKIIVGYRKQLLEEALFHDAGRTA